MAATALQQAIESLTWATNALAQKVGVLGPDVAMWWLC